MRFDRMILGSALLLLALGAGCNRDRTPRLAGAEILRVVDPAFQPLRRDFEEAAGKVRLVCVVAPTCGNCNQAMGEINGEVLYRLRDEEDLRVFVVWTSVMPTDVTPRAIRAAERVNDPRCQHYWDDSGQIARCFGRMLGVDQGTSAYDIYLVYDRDATWDPEGTMGSEPKDFRALRSGWAPGRPAARFTQHQTLDLPGFTQDGLEQALRRTLAAPAKP